MTATFRAAAYSEDSANITLPANDENDRLVAIGFDLSATAWSTPTGWTQFLTNNNNYYSWERAGPDSGTETFTATGSDYTSLFAVSSTGAHLTDSIAATPNSGTGSTATSASFDVANDGSLILFIVWCDDNGATINGTPSGMTLGHTGSGFNFIRLWYQEMDAATGITKSVTLTDTTDYSCLVLVIPPAVTTGPGTPTLSPADDAIGVATNSNFTLTFSENVKAGTGNAVLKKTSDNSTVETINITDTNKVTFSSTVCTINPSTTLDEGTGYYWQIDNGAILSSVDDEAWTGISDTTSWSFTTIFPGPQIVSEFTEVTPGTTPTSFVINFVTPAGGFQENDLIIIVVAKDDDAAFTSYPPTDWNSLDNQANSTIFRTAVIWRRLPSGFSDTSVTVTGDAEDYAAHGWVVRDAHTTTAPESAVATGSSAAADPPSLNPTNWDTENTLWLVGVGFDGNSSVSAFSSGLLSTGQDVSENATAGQRIAVAWGALWSSNASEDPGTFTNTNEQWIAYTIAVRPEPAAVVEDNNAVLFSCNF